MREGSEKPSPGLTGDVLLEAATLRIHIQAIAMTLDRARRDILAVLDAPPLCWVDEAIKTEKETTRTGSVEDHQ